MVVCPVCHRPMREVPNAYIRLCDGCGFSITEFDAANLGARSIQEAANMKYQYLLSQGWSHGPPPMGWWRRLS